ncbi:MAG: hypothetical protein P8Z42_10445, partial [Anaerolineales bacterium]
MARFRSDGRQGRRQSGYRRAGQRQVEDRRTGLPIDAIEIQEFLRQIIRNAAARRREFFHLRSLGRRPLYEDPAGEGAQLILEIGFVSGYHTRHRQVDLDCNGWPQSPTNH